MPATPTLSLDQATIGIITALSKEDTAVLEVFECCDDVPVYAPGEGAGHKYFLAKVPTRNGGFVVVAIGTLLTPGTNTAAVRATQMRQDCPNIRHIIMTGIAGAVPNLSKAEDHVRLGDIVVSNETGVVQFDLQKETDEGTTIRGQPKPPSSTLLEGARGVRIGRTKRPHGWETDITKICEALGEDWGRPAASEDRCADTVWGEGDAAAPVTTHPDDEERTDGQPRVFFGPIGSSNTLLKSSAKRDRLRDQLQVKAIEMEGSGVAAATGQTEISYLIVRGTCDYCNREKGDKWQKYAAVIAAVFTRHVIIQLDGRPASAVPPPPPDPAAPASINIQTGDGSIVQHITGGQIGSINIQPPGFGGADMQKFQNLLGRVEERLATPVQTVQGPSEQDLEDYQLRTRNDIGLMKSARQVYEHDEVGRLIAKIEPWLLSHRPHLPVELFDEAWLELLGCEKFRQDVNQNRGGKWDGTAIHRMMKEMGHA